MDIKSMKYEELKENFECSICLNEYNRNYYIDMTEVLLYPWKEPKKSKFGHYENSNIRKGGKLSGLWRLFYLFKENI
jgi:hypothetical protein